MRGIAGLRATRWFGDTRVDAAYALILMAGKLSEWMRVPLAWRLPRAGGWLHRKRELVGTAPESGLRGPREVPSG